MGLLRSVISTLWLGFALTMVPHSESTVAQNEEEFIMDCKKPLDNQTRQFGLESRENKFQSVLKYSQKPLWPLQWQMTEEILEVDGRSCNPSMKIAEMHKIGVKGKGVGIVIVGNTPVNCPHASIQSRCFAEDSTTTLTLKSKKPPLTALKQMFVSSAPDTISSEVAGIIGMSDNGDTGGVGIAPESHIGYIVVNKSSKYGSPEYCAASIVSRNTSPPAEVFVHTWDLPKHDYKGNILHTSDRSLLNFHNPKTILKPHVMGSGMYGMLANSCQCNEYSNTDSMFVFGGVTYEGYLVPTSESCASLFGVTYSTSYGHHFYNNIVTISSFDSTSYACASKSETALSAAVAGGIIALIIDYFKRRFDKPPSVSDLAFLLAFSMSSETLQDKNILWFSNGAGLMYSHQAGFGLPNMLNVKTLLAKWTPMRFPTIYEVNRFSKQINFVCGRYTRKRTLTYSSYLGCFFSIPNVLAHLRIQSVSIELSAKLVKRGALSVYLISPAGTVSCLLEGRPYDTGKKKYNKLLLRSNHFIGELLGGQWSLKLYTYQENSKPPGSEEALSPVEDDEKQPSEKRSSDEENVSNVSPKLFDSNPATSGGIMKSSDTSDGESSNLNSNNQIPRKKHVTFSEVICFMDKSPPNNAQVDNVESEPNPAKLQRLKSILREPKTEFSSADDSSSQSEPEPPIAKKRDPNLVSLNQIKFRFVLHESLPLELNAEPQMKSSDEREKNFELLKMWVDFRHFLFAQLDPQKSAKNRLEHQKIYSIQSTYVKTLTMLQKNNEIQSLSSVSPARLKAILGARLN